jgi:hypothetical protein
MMRSSERWRASLEHIIVRSLLMTRDPERNRGKYGLTATRALSMFSFLSEPLTRGKSRMRRWVKHVITGCLVGLLVGGCASAPRVAVIRDPDADFSRYESFGFHRPLGTDRESGTRTLLSQTLMKTTRMKLEALGYRFDQEGADLIVNFFIETREVVQGQRGPSYSVGSTRPTSGNTRKARCMWMWWTPSGIS